jgi:hypothetical protein
LSRRRRRDVSVTVGTSAPAGVGDLASTLVALTPSVTLLAIHDGRGGVTASGGMTDSVESLAGSAPFTVSGTTTTRPAYDGALFEFNPDNSDDFLRYSGGVVAGFTGNLYVGMIGELPLAGGDFDVAYDLSEGTNTKLACFQDSTNTNMSIAASALLATLTFSGLTGRRILHTRRVVTGTDTTKVGIAFGSGAETTGVGTIALGSAPDRVTYFSNRSGAGNYGPPAACFIWCSGVTDANAASVRSAVNTFATTYHGATA